MTNKKSTKRALLLSALSLLLCVSMLVGSTFAWFTDSVTSGNNIIKSGNLDVELEYKKVVDGVVSTNWASVKDQDNIFNKEALWEPGHVEVVYLKVSNLGTLALKYQLGVNVIKETLGKTETGEDIKLSEHLVFKVVEMPNALTTYTDREAVKLAAGTAKGLTDYNGKTTALDAKGGANAEDYVALIVYMPETVGNEANYRGDAIPTIELGINLYATQYTAEEDSFDEFYDKNAWVKGFKVYNANELQGAINAGESAITLMDNIDATEAVVIPEGKTVALNLNGKTISAATTAIENNGTLILDGNGKIDVSGATEYAVPVTNNGTLTVNGGEYVGASSMPSYGLENYGTMTINKATVDGGFGGVWAMSNSETVINDGTFSHRDDPGAHIVFAKANAKVTINGGDFLGHVQSNGNYQYVVYAATGADVEINGGNFVAFTHANGTTRLMFAAGSPVAVYGGTFDKDPTGFVADGYETKANADGTYTVAMKSETLTDLFANVQNGGSVTLPEGTYTIPATVAGKNITIEGIGKGTVMDFTTGNNVGNASITFKNLHIQGKNENVMNGYGIQHTTGDIVYEDCTFDGAVTGEYYGTVTYKNCTFTGVGYITTYALKSATFENCVFDKADSRAVLVYSHGNNPCVVTINGCDFKAAKKAYTWSGDWTAAIEVDTTNIPSVGTSVAITDCTYDANYSGLVRDKSAAGKANAVITVDGKFVAAAAEQLRYLAANATGDVKVLLSSDITLGNDTDVCYAVNFANASSVTIDGNGNSITLKGKAAHKSDTSLDMVAGIISAGDITVKNVTLVNDKLSYFGTETSGDRIQVYTTISGASVAYENVTFDGGVRVKGNETFKNCNFTETVLAADASGYAKDGRFCMFIDHEWETAGTYVVTMEGCSFNASGYGCVKVAGDKGSTITVNVKDCTFYNTCPSNSWDQTTPKYDVKMTGSNITVNDLGGNTWAKGYGNG